MAADPSPSRTLRLTLEYDGSRFSGWQRNPGMRTVQGTLNEALRVMTGASELEAHGASRTDAGVHALGQVASFRCATSIPADGFRMGLNSMLPDDLAVRRCEEVPGDFHARHRARGKRYRYLLYTERARSPLRCGHSWRIYGALDCDAMRRAAECLEGEHDFSAFRASGCAAASPVKRISRLRILPITGRPLLLFEVLGSAFLKYMVRNLVGSLVQIGLGRQPWTWARQVLEARDRKLAGPTAPARGLALCDVFYREGQLEEEAAAEVSREDYGPWSLGGA